MTNRKIAVGIILFVAALTLTAFAPGGKGKIVLITPTQQADDSGEERAASTNTPAWDPTEAVYYTEVANWATFQNSEEYGDFFSTWAAPNYTPPPPYPAPVDVTPEAYPYPEP